LFFYVRDAAATRGQYLALSKVWRSCFCLFYRTVCEHTWTKWWNHHHHHHHHCACV